jgi:hypothetical protein
MSCKSVIDAKIKHFITHKSGKLFSAKWKCGRQAIRGENGNGDRRCAVPLNNFTETMTHGVDK